MPPRADTDPTIELESQAGGEQDGGESTVLAAQRAAHAMSLGVRGVERVVAQKAMDALPEALDVIIGVMRKPGRGAQSQLTAAFRIVDVAMRYQAETSAAGADTRAYVLDRAEAARVLAKRLGLPE